MEFVFEPDLVDGEEAAALVKELAFTLQLLGVCSGKMEGRSQKSPSNCGLCTTSIHFTSLNYRRSASRGRQCFCKQLR